MSEAPQLDLGFVRRGGRTVLDRRLFRWPFVVTRSFHLDRAPAHMLSVILQTASGAIHADDSLRQVLHVGAGAAAHVTSQSATPVHRAPDGLVARDHVALTIEPGGMLEYCPEPKILFPDAALRQTTEIDCRPGGTAVITDAFLLHDPDATGKGIRQFEAATIVRGERGEPLLVDRMILEALSPGRGRRGALRAFGTLLALLPPGEATADTLCEGLNAAVDGIEGLYGAASPLPNGAGAGLRFAAEGGIPLRLGLETGWRITRQALTGHRPEARRK